MNVLLTSVGRRVSLLRAFQTAAHARGGRVYAADLDSTAPGLYVADGGALVPRVSDPAYVPRLLDLVRRWQIGLIVPLIDPELAVLARAEPELRASGARPLVPSPEVVEIGADKLQTAERFAEFEIPGPRTAVWSPEWQPWAGRVVVKPRFGSNSAHIARCSTVEEIAFHAVRTPDPLVQEHLDGDEITVDILCDFEGRLLQVVPRRRLKVRGGEVERAVTEWDEATLPYLVRLAEALRPAGVINLQYFRTPAGPRFTEINPRFGGGYPLAHAAGADFPAALLDLLLGRPVAPSLGQFERGLHMLRYDAEVFRPGGELLRCEG